jgi:broad specificity phosphatase PhoE
MTTVYIVQHGEKERLPGDPGLTETGRDQAARTAQWVQGLPIFAAYASDLRRALETAAIVAAPFGLDVSVDARVRERLNWEGGDADAFFADWARTVADRDFTPASGDSSRAAGARFRAAIIDIAAAHPDRSVVVAAHGGVTYDLIRTLLGDAAAPELADGVPSCAITTLDVDGDTLSVRDIANTAHLSDVST